MWNDTNPTTLYLGTTWELISSNKYIKSGSTAMQTGGRVSFSITKTNLPNVKLSLDSHFHSLTEHTHIQKGHIGGFFQYSAGGGNPGIGIPSQSNVNTGSAKSTMGSSSGYTEALGNGTSINLDPEYITLKFWKRLS